MSRMSIILVLIFTGVAMGFCGVMDEIEIVESIPVETILDIDSLRNTPEVWQELISAAQKCLDIETFYISQKAGEPLDVILQEIQKAASRGVRVRIISEAKFYKTYPEPLKSLSKIKNIDVRIIDFNKISGGVMHAKYFIVDREQVFVGSQNFDWRALKHIHELGIRIRNAEISDVFTRLFENDWQLANNRILQHQPQSTQNFMVPVNLTTADGTIAVTPVFSPRDFLPYENLWDLPFIISLIDDATEEIDIQLLSYTTVDWKKNYFEELDNALRRAAARGVKIKLLCSDWSKRRPRIDYLKSLQTVPNIEVKLSTIPVYSGGFIPYARVEHCKYMVVDRKQLWIGTSNWSREYFYSSRNAGFIISYPKLARTVFDFFYNSWKSPYAYMIDPCEEYAPPKIGGKE